MCAVATSVVETSWTGVSLDAVVEQATSNKVYTLVTCFKLLAKLGECNHGELSPARHVNLRHRSSWVLYVACTEPQQKSVP